MAINPKHVNNGECEKCREILDRYPNFHAGLRAWFVSLQRTHRDLHVSDAGRGRALQSHYFRTGASRARYGQSSHNYNAALDLFRLTQTGVDYGPVFRDLVAKAVQAHNALDAVRSNQLFQIEWYGAPGAAFPELPHVEVRGWRALGLAPVEPFDERDTFAPTPKKDPTL